MDNIPVVRLLKELMVVPSITENEEAVGIVIEDRLKTLGYTTERTPIAPNSTRHNIYAYFGNNRQTRVCLSAHMDTVPPHIPFQLEGDAIFGRGACDDKGPMAAQICAVEELRRGERIKGGDVGLLFVVGEEQGGHGMLAMNGSGLTWDAVIFAEPTEMKLCLGHKGHLVFQLQATGVAAHSGYPHLGRSANSVMLAALHELEMANWPKSKILGSSTFHVGKIQGGVALNILAPTCSAICAVRVATRVEEIQQMVEDIVQKYPELKVSFTIAYGETLLDHDIAGLDKVAVSFGTDIPKLRGHHKKYLFGPGSILTAHSDNEHIKIDELVKSVDIYKMLVLHCLESNAQ